MTHYERILAGQGGPPDECWPFTGRIRSDGRGTLKHQGKAERVSTLAYRTHVGPIPKDVYVDHTCGWVRCWNPAHLVLRDPKVTDRIVRVTQLPGGKWVRRVSEDGTDTVDIFPSRQDAQSGLS